MTRANHVPARDVLESETCHTKKCQKQIVRSAQRHGHCKTLPACATHKLRFFCSNRNTCRLLFHGRPLSRRPFLTWLVIEIIIEKSTPRPCQSDIDSFQVRNVARRFGLRARLRLSNLFPPNSATHNIAMWTGSFVCVSYRSLSNTAAVCCQGWIYLACRDPPLSCVMPPRAWTYFEGRNPHLSCAMLARA